MLSKKSSYYASQILQLLFSRAGISRAEVAELLGIDKAVVTNVVSYLIEMGYVEEGTDGGGKHSGRRRIPLHLSESSGCILGLEVQPEFVSISALSPSGRIILSKLETRPDPEGALVPAIETAVRGVLPDLENRGLRLLGIGAGLSGIVDPGRGVLTYSMMLGAEHGEIEVAGPLREAFGVPVFVDNDANCCCYGALIYPEHPRCNDFLYVFGEFEDDAAYSDSYRRISIGMGLVLGGRVHYGARNASGEFRSGASVAGVPGQFSRHTQEEYYAIKSDPDLLGEFIREVAQNVAFIANILDLSAVYFGGGIEVYQTLMRPALEEAVQVNWTYSGRLPRSVAAYFANAGDKPVARGAAAIVLQHIFSGPDYDGFGPVGLDLLQHSVPVV